jgi:hypothetical protein
MKVGFTGTRQGMSLVQKEIFKRIIKELQPTEFHHGDCIGADKNAHEVLRNICPETKIILHPGITKDKISRNRAFCKGDVLYEVKDYLPRNKDIVDYSDIIVGTPKEDTFDYHTRSGTWFTLRYALKCRKKTIIIFPMGDIRTENKVEILNEVQSIYPKPNGL